MKTLVFLIGPPAVGKMTVGAALRDLTGFPLFHNHQSIEGVLPIFDFGTPAFDRLVSEFRLSQKPSKRDVEASCFPVTPAAVSFDFFQTLAHHRGGGRGRALMTYLTSEGFAPRPWEHQFLYDVLEPHAREYSPDHTFPQKRAYFSRLARRLFECLEIRCSDNEPARHADRIWELIGPNSLELFDDVMPTLTRLRAMRVPMVIISNWQCGLGHFCTELGVGAYFDHVIGSAEIGYAKPEREIFDAALSRLGVPPDRVLHVGDSVADDVHGARAVGMHAVRIDRHPTTQVSGNDIITSLDAVPRLLADRGSGSGDG